MRASGWQQEGKPIGQEVIESLRIGGSPCTFVAPESGRETRLLAKAEEESTSFGAPPATGF